MTFYRKKAKRDRIILVKGEIHRIEIERKVTNIAHILERMINKR